MAPLLIVRSQIRLLFGEARVELQAPTVQAVARKHPHWYVTYPGLRASIDSRRLSDSAWRLGERIEEVPLKYAGFLCQSEAARPGASEVIVYAYQPANGNTGLDRVTSVIGE